MGGQESCQNTGRFNWSKEILDRLLSSAFNLPSSWKEKQVTSLRNIVLHRIHILRIWCTYTPSVSLSLTIQPSQIAWVIIPNQLMKKLNKALNWISFVTYATCGSLLCIASLYSCSCYIRQVRKTRRSKYTRVTRNRIHSKTCLVHIFLYKS